MLKEVHINPEFPHLYSGSVVEPPNVPHGRDRFEVGEKVQVCFALTGYYAILLAMRHNFTVEEILAANVHWRCYLISTKDVCWVMMSEAPNYVKLDGNSWRDMDVAAYLTKWRNFAFGSNLVKV